MTKCKICGEYISATNKTSHLLDWRNPEKLLDYIQKNDINKFNTGLSHGADVSYVFEDQQKYSNHLFILHVNEEI